MRGALALALLLAAPGTVGQTALERQPGVWRGDFDGMLERRLVRVAVPYSRTLYFNDKGRQRGLTADTLRDFEIDLNRRYPPKGRPITVAALPMPRDRMLAELAAGRVDLAAGNLTITAARDRLVDFSMPIFEGVTEIVVTGPASPPLATLDDLSGQEVQVLRSSSYYGSLVALNARFRAARRPQMKLTVLPETLEDEDMMDMLGAGLLGLIVVDDWKAGIWAGMRAKPKIRPRPDLAVSEAQSIGWAFRNGSPKLAEEVNRFIRTHPGSRNARVKEYPRYLKELRNVTAESDWRRFERTIPLFRKYGARYGFDPLLLAAQGYQESGLDQNARSHPGAVGIMQLMPETGAAMKVGDIHQPEANVHAGAKYLRQLHDRYFRGAELDEQNRTLFAIAAYNAGPSRVAALRTEAEKTGLDPNAWFGNVELVAARRVGQEPVTYVRNVYKYYVAYKLQLDVLEARRAAGGVVPPAKK